MELNPTPLRQDPFGSVILMENHGNFQGLSGCVLYTRRSEDMGNIPVPLVAVHNGPVRDGFPNGFFVEDLIAIASHRVGVLNSQFACPENALAIKHLESALAALDMRTERVARERAQQQQP